MRKFLTLFRTEAKLVARGGDMLFFGVLFPVGIMLLVGFISPPEQIRLAFAGIATVGIAASGLMGIPLTFASYRHEKILKRFQVTPASPALLLSAVTLVQTLFALVSGAAVFLIARYIFGVDLGGSLPRFALSFLAVLIGIYGIGFLIASMVPDIKTANLVCSLVYFPTLMLSGTTVPYEIMPRPLQMFSDLFPLTQGIKILKGAVLGTNIAEDGGRVVALGAIAALSYIVSLRVFRWE